MCVRHCERCHRVRDVYKADLDAIRTDLFEHSSELIELLPGEGMGRLVGDGKMRADALEEELGSLRDLDAE
jgi:hypothetical protein